MKWLGLLIKRIGRRGGWHDVYIFTVDSRCLGEWSDRALAGIAAPGGIPHRSALFAANGMDDVNGWLDAPAAIGVELLLFAIGLKMNPRSIFRV